MQLVRVGRGVHHLPAGVLYLSQLVAQPTGVDRPDHRQLGRAAVSPIGSRSGRKAVLLDVIEDGGAELTERRRAFYAAMGFQSLPSRPLRMFISIETVRKGRP